MANHGRNHIIRANELSTFLLLAFSFEARKDVRAGKEREKIDFDRIMLVLIDLATLPNFGLRN